MENRNLTLNLPADLIRQAKIYAAEHDTTINSVVRELLEETVSRVSRSRAAAERLLALAGHELWSDVDPATISRDELHERS